MIITDDPEFYIKQLLEFGKGSETIPRSDPTRGSRPQRVANALEIKVYTVKEAAAALHPNVSKSAIYRAIQSGKLRARMVGKKYLITERNIKEFLECQEEKNHHASGSGKTKEPGLSSTVESKSGRDIALTSAKRLKKRSGGI
ncbi:MAG: helix-turn-helix domain-containing protein [Pseudomonadota bacterium]